MWLLFVVSAFAESWCAVPIVAHEWGVQVFNGDGTRGSGLAIPDAYHQTHVPHTNVSDVRDLPPDGGNRCVPVVQFFGRPFNGQSVPLGVGVSFDHGDAVAWYPQTDVPSDSDAQHELLWQDLTLRTSTDNSAPATSLDWPRDLRTLDDALWVEHGTESERFLFYEGATTESADIVLRRVPTRVDATPALRIHNSGITPMHSILVTQRDPWGSVWSFEVSVLDAGETVDVVGSDASASDPRAWLRSHLVVKPPPQDVHFSLQDNCVSMRDPSVGVSASKDHRLYPGEVDTLLDAWHDRFFEAEGLTVIYREDAARLKRAMPLAIYTDMYHHITLSRLGLVLVEDAVIEP